MIYSKDVFVLKVHKDGFIAVEITDDFLVNNKINLSYSNYEEFIEFAKTINVKHIFYNYVYTSIGDYLIDVELYDNYSENVLREMKKHNKEIKKIDFNRPSTQQIALIEYGFFMCVQLEDYWIEDIEIETKTEKVESIKSEYSKEVSEINNVKKAETEHDKNELREIILNDPEFYHCKNQQLRYYYLTKLFDEREDIDRFHYLVSPYGAPHIGKIKNFMDETWRLFRERIKYDS